MNALQLRCLFELEHTQNFVRSAQACELSPEDFLKTMQSIEADMAQQVLKPGTEFAGFTAEGLSVLAWAHRYEAECTALRSDLRRHKNEESMRTLLGRRSVSPKRLQAPGPDAHDLTLLLQAALRAPDHGDLHPWRVIEFQTAQREALADSFEHEKRRRDPMASARDLQLAREHATRPPVLLAFVVSPRARNKVPVREQWLAAGAALGNFLNAAHQIGFGAIVLSGERCFDAVLTADLGIQPDEFLAGFISVGSIAEAPPAKPGTPVEAVWSAWSARSAEPATLNSATGRIASD